MGSFSLWHWLIVLFMLAIPLGVVFFIVWLVNRTSKSSRSAAGAYGAPLVELPRTGTSEARLLELSDLRVKGLVTEAEYERKRAEILGGV